MFFKTLLPFFRPLGWGYSLITGARSFLYTHGILSRYRLPVPVVSVGNLTMGGGGKTPLVFAIASFLQSRGLKVAIVSRGYGGKARNSCNIVSDGREVLLDVREAGDEPFLLAKRLPGVSVLTGKKRIHPCRYAVDRLACEVIVLDDGFQHMAVERDLDLVLFSSTLPFSLLHVLPGGYLREPFAALSRADCFLLTGYDDIPHDIKNKYVRKIFSRWPRIPVTTLQYSLTALTDQSFSTQALTDLPQPAFAFCGIASPDSFSRSLRRLGIKLVGFKSFPDHMNYSKQILEKIHARARESKARCLLTTEKDLVKLRAFSPDLPLYAFTVEVEQNHVLERMIIDRLGPGHGPL